MLLTKKENIGYLHKDMYLTKVIIIMFSLFVIYITLCLFYRSLLEIPIMYNEGWNAGLLSNWVYSGKLYYEPSEFIVNNYPPISFIINRFILTFLHDAIFSGRLTSALSFVACAFLIMRIIKYITNNNYSAFLSCLIFIGFIDINDNLYVASNDPQMLSLAINLLGLYVFIILLTQEEKTILYFIVSFIFVFALFIKHNSVAMPLAVAVWLIIYKRSAFFIYSISGLIISFCFFAVFDYTFGTFFINGIFSPRQYSLHRLFRLLIPNLSPILPVAIFAVMPNFLLKYNKFTVLFTIYVGLALFIGAFELGGDGTGSNALFELILASSLGCGMLAATFNKIPENFGGLYNWSVISIIISIVITPGMVESKSFLRTSEWIKEIQNKEITIFNIINIIKSTKGDALCETNTFCYWSGKKFSFDRFNFSQKLLFNIGIKEKLLCDIIKGKYSVIEFDKYDDIYSMEYQISSVSDCSREQEIKFILNNKYKKITFPGSDIVLFIKS